MKNCFFWAALALLAATLLSNAGILHAPLLPQVGAPVKLVMEHGTCDAWEILDADGNIVNRLSAEEAWIPQETGFYTLRAMRDGAVAEELPKVPVVWRELRIFTWTDPQYCRYVGTDVFFQKGISGTPDSWRKRGSRVLGTLSLRPGHLFGKSDEEVVEWLIERARAIKADGFDGFGIDELGVYPDAQGVNFVRQCTAAFTAIAKEMPEMAVINWTGGPLLREEMQTARDARHLFMAEFYPEFATSYFGAHHFGERLRVWIDKLRNQDALCDYTADLGAIIALGVGGVCGVAEPAIVEERIRIYKRLAPEAPGICYYFGNTEGADAREYSAFLDRMTERYFLNPVVSLVAEDLMVPGEPTAGQPCQVTVMVHNFGGMKAKNVAVELLCQTPDGGQQLVASRELPEIGNGLLRLNLPPFDSTQYRHTLNGTEYPMTVDAGRKQKVVFTDRALLDMAWCPAQRGWHKLIARIAPGGNYTGLDTCAEKMVVVK
ncbi:MAG: hypothetical protein GX946_07450 [Oligosphaeraceae bacterium]|nr:hypothetical protein [Oligosphaeraceae bacterium]